MDRELIKNNSLHSVFEEVKLHRFTWSDRYAPEEYVRAKMIVYVHCVNAIQDIYPEWSLEDCCSILDITEHEYKLFKILVNSDDDTYDKYIAAVKEAMQEGYFVPAIIKNNIPESPLSYIIEHHHKSALDMYDRTGISVGWSSEQLRRAQMICNYWEQLKNNEENT